tara:strand:+ start:3186 stop:3464 length:279 start_codon:yes stop_codon:yes gene_type:complete
MNKSEIIENLSNKNQYSSRKDLEESLHLIVDFITSSLADRNRVEIRGFGTFSTRQRNQRIARNPKTGTSIKVQKKLHPYFRAAKNLKESLNK